MRPIRIRSLVPLVVVGALAVLTNLGQPLSSDWNTIQVPGAWELTGPPEARDYDGIAWFRTWVKPDNSFFIKHERNLFEESVIVNIRDLADAHEVFVNGEKVGSGGRFPPQFKSGQNQIHRHKIPVGTFKKSLWNEVAFRVYNRTGKGGFISEAPFVMNYFMECALEGTWQFRLGDFPIAHSEPLSEKPAVSAFGDYHESHRVLGEAVEYTTGPRLSPGDSLANFQASEDLVVEQLLHEPQIAQPVYFSFDERGRLWVAEYRQYPYPAGLKMLSRDKYYRSHYNQMPPAPPNHDRGRDVISVHEDSNGDGDFDTHKTFLEGLNMANAALRGRGGVWVMHTPYLLFYPDADFDDHPDGPPEVRLQGFGFEDSHSVANGLVWGMDGWLYGAQGSTTSSRVTRPGIDPPDVAGVYFEGCMVWRYHPETHDYQIFAEGTGNTFGLEIDAEGRLFSGHNGGDTRGWHYIQGGYYLMQGVDPGKFGPTRNPHAFGDLPMMRTATTVRRFSHFAAVVEGTALPWKYAGTFFALDPIHSVVIAAERRLRGATFETADIGPVLSSSDPAFRPVYIANAPDGSLFIADMYEYYIAHGQHYQNQIDHTTGRVYRLRGAQMPLEKDTNLYKKTSAELVALLSHSNKWHRHTAVRLLSERKDHSVAQALREIIAGEAGRTALCALWALYQLNDLDAETALAALQHPYGPVRMWAVRLLADRWGAHPGLGLGDRMFSARPEREHQIPDPQFQGIIRQMIHETDPEVRSQAAASARRLSIRQAFPLVLELLKHDEDFNDPYIPLLCWWVFEANAWENRNEIAALFKSETLWSQAIVSEHILPRLMRRFAVDGRQEGLILCAKLLRLAPAPQHISQLMKGFEEAYRGRSISDLPDELLGALAATGQSPLILRVRQGERTAIDEALNIIADPNATLENRMLYTRVFGQVRADRAAPALLSLAKSGTADELRKTSLVSLSLYDAAEIGSQIASLLPDLSPELRNTALALLASRAHWTVMLLNAIQAGVAGASAIPDDIVARIQSHNDAEANALLTKLGLPRRNVETPDFRRRIAEVEDVLSIGTGNPYAGETLFTERCASCHKLFFKGGRIGPDLTNYQRANLGTLLTGIINPNAEIREGYAYFLIETKDGRTVSGFLVDRDNQVTVVRGFEGEDIFLQQQEIDMIRPMNRSLMPEGLIDDLSEQQLRDLFAYLRISQPITR